MWSKNGAQQPVVEAVLERMIREVGAERVAIRLSPGAYFNMEGDPGDADVFRVLLEKLNRLGLAYIHAGIIDDSTNFDYLGGRVTDFLRRHYEGVLVGKRRLHAPNGGAGVRREPLRPGRHRPAVHRESGSDRKDS